MWTKRNAGKSFPILVASLSEHLLLLGMDAHAFISYVVICHSLIWGRNGGNRGGRNGGGNGGGRGGGWGYSSTWKNKRVAIANLDALFTDYDVEAASEILSSEYIQHSPYAMDGKETVLGFIPFFEEIGMNYTNHRIISEGDMVMTHNEFDNAGAFGFGSDTLITFDLYRVKDGQIAEHWDNIFAGSPTPNLSGNTMVDGETKVCDRWKTAQNKELVLEFYYLLLGGADLTAALLGDYMSETYIQHGVDARDGLAAFLEDYDPPPADAGVEVTPRIIIAEGNFVFIASEVNMPDGSGDIAAFDLFRVEDGLLAEHWDIVAPIPAESSNDNGYF